MVPACRGIPGFTHTILSQTSQRAQRKYLEIAINASYLSNDQCAPLQKEFTCASYLRPCVENGTALLCQDKCLKFHNVCQSSVLARKDVCNEMPKRGKGTSMDSAICKVKHWPLSSHWHLPDEEIAPSVTPSLGKARPAFCCFQIVCLFNVVVILAFFFFFEREVSDTGSEIPNAFKLQYSVLSKQKLASKPLSKIP